MVITLGTGCAAKFAGQWLQDPIGPDDAARSGIRPYASRLALDFDPFATVRCGSYVDHAGMVDASSVQFGQFTVYDGGDRIQFGEIMARVSGDHMTAWLAGGETRQFSRVKTTGVFPPYVSLEALSAQ